MPPKKKRLKYKNPVSEKDVYIDWDGEFDPTEYLNTMIETKLDNRVLTDIDERELPRAANFVEFCYGKNFLNFPPFPRAIQIVASLFGEICPFCSDEQTRQNLYSQKIDEIYDKVVFTRYGVCPKCKKTRIDFLKARKYWFPDRLVAIIGQRAGKNFMFVQAQLYLLHRFLTFERNNKRITPYDYYGLAPGPLRMTFTAITLGQAMKTLWGPFTSIFEDAPWFQEYGRFLTYHGKRKGVELYTNNSTFIVYKNKRIDVACSAPDQRTLRGATRFSFGIDEVCWFDAGGQDSKSAPSKVLGSIDDIHTSLSNSLRTIRNAAMKRIKAGDYDCPTGYSFDISSPCHANDIGMMGLREAQKNVFISAWNFATWQFNPEYESEESFKADYIKDPIKADRDFGAIPPLTVSPWMSDARPVVLASRTQQEPMIITHKVCTEINPFGEVSTWFKLESIKDATTPRILAIDNGLTSNAFAAVLLSVRKGVSRVDECFMLKPNESENIKVNLDKMFEEFVYPLASKCNIVLGLYDRWNSIQNIQKLRGEGKDWRQYSLTPNDFDMLRGKLQSSEVSLPFSEFDLNVFLKKESADTDLVRLSMLKPNFGLILQILTVRSLGVRVVKPLYGDDDVFRAAALGIKHLYEDDIRKVLDTTYNPFGDKPKGGYGVVSYVTKSGGSGGSSRSGAPSKIVAVKTKSR